MRKWFYIFSVILLAKFASATSALWFCILADQEIREDGITKWDVADWMTGDSGDGGAAGKEVAFRIRVFGEGVGEDTFLPLYYTLVDPETGISVTDTATELSLTLPLNFQQASVGEYADYSLSLELGTIDYTTDPDGEFIT